MALKKRIWVLLLALLMNGCSGSILFAVKRSFDQSLQCDCESERHQEEISEKVKNLPAKERQFHRYYRGWCCDHEVFLECQARVQNHRTAVAPPSQTQGPVGDVAWSCWEVENPTRKRGEAPMGKVPEIDPLDLVCQAYCAQELRCGTGNFGDQECLCACRHRFLEPLSHLTVEFAQVAGLCIENLECKRSDDICFARGSQAVLKKTPNKILLEKRCMEVRKNCRFWGDLCRALVGLREEYFSKASACLAGECSTIEDCLLDAVGRKDRSNNPNCRKPQQAK